MRCLIIAAVLALGPHAHADCAMWGLAPKVLTPANAVVSRDGGVVVAAVAEARGKLDHGDVAVQSSWRLRVGSDSIKPPIDVLAPGLAVYRVAVANAFKVELDNGGTVVATVKTTRDHVDPIAAPKIKRVWFEKSPSRRTAAQVAVALDGGVPSGAVALVLADDQGVARSWTLATAGDETLYPYRVGDCRALPNGTVASKAGDKITLLWLDSAGRASAATKPITIASPP